LCYSNIDHYGEWQYDIKINDETVRKIVRSRFNNQRSKGHELKDMSGKPPPPPPPPSQ
jgi:hypothetical protein